jgi:hypothetical protein
MANPNPHDAFRDALLAQEKTVSGPQYIEYRRRLEAKLRQATARARRSRVITFVVCALALASGPLLMIADRLPLPNTGRDVLGIVLATAAGCAVPFLLLYLLWHRPALDRARHEAQDAALVELQRQLTELRERFPSPQ